MLSSLASSHPLPPSSSVSASASRSLIRRSRWKVNNFELQVNPANKSQFSSISPERGFADFLFAHVRILIVVINWDQLDLDLSELSAPGDSPPDCGQLHRLSSCGRLWCLAIICPCVHCVMRSKIHGRDHFLWLHLSPDFSFAFSNFQKWFPAPDCSCVHCPDLLLPPPH